MRGTCKRALVAVAAWAVAFACAVAAVPSGSAWAATAPDATRRGSITAKVTSDDVLEAGRLELTHVASFSPAGELVLDEAFAGAGVDLGLLSAASDWRQAAEELATWADGHGVPATLARETRGSGSFAFYDLECGLYLVRGYDLSSEAKAYDCGSTLLSVPVLEGGEWVYDVEADLKASVSEKGREPGEPAMPEAPVAPVAPSDDAARSGSGDLAGTGDHTSAVPAVACVAAGCALVALAVIRGRRG